MLLLGLAVTLPHPAQASTSQSGAVVTHLKGTVEPANYEMPDAVLNTVFTQIEQTPTPEAPDQEPANNPLLIVAGVPVVIAAAGAGMFLGRRTAQSDKGG